MPPPSASRPPDSGTQGDDETRRTLLEAIAQRVPREGKREVIRRIFFPSSAHQLRLLYDPYYTLPAGATPPRSDWFEWVSLFMILVNSVVLAVSAPLEPTTDVRNQVSNTVDNVLTVFFIFETALRIAAFGSVLFSEDRWFVVDTVVVAGSSVAFVGSFFASGKSGFSLSGLRSFRLLKPIRSLRAISAARVIIGSILASVAGLQDVLTLTIMVMLLLGVGGVSQYNSRLVNRCISQDYFVSPLALTVFDASNLTKQDYIRHGAYENLFITAMVPIYTWATHGRNPNVTGGQGHSLAHVGTFFAALRDPDLAFHPDMTQRLLDAILNTTTFDSVRLPCATDVNVTELPASVQRFYVNCSQPYHSMNVTKPTGEALFQLLLDAYGSAWTVREFSTRWSDLQTAPSWLIGMWQDQSCNKVDAVLLNGYRCPANYECDDVQNPMNGILGFDNLAQALLTVFIFSTFQQWFFVGGMMADAVDDTSQIYFFAIVLFVGLFVMNLIVAQITSSFEVAYAEEKQLLEDEKRRQELLDQKDGSGAVAVPDTIDAAINAKVKAKVKAVSDWIADRVEQDRIAFDENDSDDDDDKRAIELQIAKVEQAEAFRQALAEADPRHAAAVTGATPSATSGRARSVSGTAGGGASSAVMASLANMATVRAALVQVSKGELKTSSATDHALAAAIRDARRAEQMNSIPDPSDAERQRKKEEAEANRIKSVADLRLFVMKKLNSQAGLLIVSVVILLNVVSLAMDYHGESENYSQALNMAALFFDIFFTIEVLTRWFAYGFFGYLRHFTNWIDCIVVLLSWLDVLLSSFNAPIIRALRLLRLYAVFKAFEELRMWLVVIRHALKATLILAVVCLCALFIVACLGMQIFGAQLCNQPSDARPDNTNALCPNRPRSNFDDITTALLTSFQLMTGDNWDNVLYTGYTGYSPWSSVFFIAWYVLSNVILVNLVIAIVLEARAEVIEREASRALEREILERSRRQIDPAYQRRREEEEERRQRHLAMNGPQTVAPLPLIEDVNENQELLKDIMTSTIVRRLILGVVFAGTVMMAFESPIEAPDGTVATILRACDIAVCALFMVEMALKILCHGLWKSPTSYLKQTYWNWVDIFVVLAGFVAALCLYWTPLRLGSLTQRLVSAFRALRPIRFVCISQTLRDVLGVLASAIAPLRHLAIVIILTFTFWGILGVQLFKGTFYSCSDAQYPNRTSCLNASSPNQWVLSESHFNHLPAAYTTLFTVITLDGWTAIMWDGIDAVSEEEGFVVNYNPAAALYFVSFVVVGNFFFLNLFISVLIEGYDSAKSRKKTASGKQSPFLTPMQNAWIRSHHVVLNLVPQIDYDNDETQEHTHAKRFYVVFRRRIRTFVRHPLFDVIVYCFIVVNFAVMAADRYPKSQSMALVVTFANTTFTVLFAFELILRIISDTPQRFFFYKWNQFDTVIVVVSLASLVMEYVLSSTTFASFFRTLRVLRLLRLLRKTRRLQIVLKRFVLTLLSLVNIAALIALLFVVFGLIGMKLFGRVAHNGAVGLHSNFEDPVNALFMLMRMCTGGSWTPVMVQLASTADDNGACDPQLDNCGINIVAQVYFVIFISIGSFVVLNLFVAVVLDTFTAGQEEDFGFLSEWEGGQLLQLWLRFDPDFTFRMESRFFVSFLRSIPKESVLGVFARLPEKQRFRHELISLSSMRLTEYGGLVELQDVIFALCRRAYAFQKRKIEGADETDEWYGVDRDDLTERQLERRWRPIELSLLDSRRLDRKADVWFRKEARDARRPTGTEYDVAVRFAVMLLEQYWIRRVQMRRRNAHFRRRREEFLELLRLEMIAKSNPVVVVTPTAAPQVPDDQASAVATAEAAPLLVVPSLTAAAKRDAEEADDPARMQPSITRLVQAHRDQQLATDRETRVQARRVVNAQAQLLAQQVSTALTVREKLLQARRGGLAQRLSVAELLAMGEALQRHNASVAEAAQLRRAEADAARPLAPEETHDPEPESNAPKPKTDSDDDADFLELL